MVVQCGNGNTRTLPCTSTHQTYRVNVMESLSRRRQTAETLKAESFGSACVIAARQSASGHLTLSLGRFRAAGVSGTRKSQRRPRITAIQPEGRSLPSIPHGLRCTQGAATLTTIVSIGTAAEASLYASAGHRSRGSLPIWERAGSQVFLSTGSTTTGTTSQAIADGQRRRIRPPTETHGKAGQNARRSRFRAVMVRKKKDGGGWSEEQF